MAGPILPDDWFQQPKQLLDSPSPRVFPAPNGGRDHAEQLHIRQLGFLLAGHRLPGQLDKGLYLDLWRSQRGVGALVPDDPTGWGDRSGVLSGVSRESSPPL